MSYNNYNNLISSSIILTICSLHIMIISAASKNLTGDSYLGSTCLNSTKNITSTYSQSLSYAVDEVCAKAPLNGGFFQTMRAEDPSNRVYALALCRGDISSADCTDCLTRAAIQVANYDCPNKTGAVTWSDYCLLKYSDVDFNATVDTDNHFNSSTGPLVTNDDDYEFRVSVSSITRATIIAAVADEDLLFAYAMIVIKRGNSNGTEELYAMAQCTGDLNTTDCITCLVKAYNRYLVGKDGARYYYGSCTLRYETSPFSQLLA